MATPSRSLLSLRPLVVAALLVPAAGCVAEVTSREAHRLIDTKGGQLIDVRAPWEFDEGHPPGAINVPLDKLDARLATLPRDRPLVVYCHTGVRAKLAVGKLRRAGFTSVYNMGTIYRWKADPRGDVTPFD